MQAMGEFFSTFKASGAKEEGAAPEPPLISVNVSEADGKTALSIPAGWTVIGGGAGEYGHIDKIDGIWTFVHDRLYAHNHNQGRNLAESADNVRILMSDPNGGARIIEVPVSIEDDVTTKSRDKSMIDLPDTFIQGPWFSVEMDGKEARGMVRVSSVGDHRFENGMDGAIFVWGPGESDKDGNYALIRGTYGTLIDNVNGSYLYVNDEKASRALIPGENGMDEFTVCLCDVYGDDITHTITFARIGCDDPITFVANDRKSMVWESALPDGTDPDH